MSDLFEAYWERYSDELSTLLDEISASENLVRGNLDDIHMASVQLFKDKLKSLLERPPLANPQIAGLMRLPRTSTRH